MKILFVHPELRSGTQKEPRLQAAVAALRARGAVVLQSSGVAEAFQVLQFHGRTIDLAIVHREGHGAVGEPGLALLRQIRAVPTQQDLPLIVTTSVWNESECARHQNSPDGVHAYFPIPAGREWGADDLCSLVNAVTGGQLEEAFRNRQALQSELESATASASASVLPASIAVELAASDPAPAGETRLVALSDLSSEYERQGGQTRSGLSIQLELPSEEESGAPSVIPVGMTLAPAIAIEEPAPAAAAPVSGLELELSTPSPAPASLTVEPAPAALPLEFPVNAASGIVAAVETDPAEGEIRSEFPYLFAPKGESSTSVPERGSRWESLPPVGDAIVPGGAANSPDTEVLKKYLALREEDVAALSRQLKLAHERNQALEQDLAVERARGTELAHENESQKQRIAGFERETQVLFESRDRELAELSLQVKTKNDRLMLLEMQLREASEEVERVRERVRADLRRIRVRERELENRIEVMKRDQEALLTSREARLGELKRRTDLLEFNNELLNEQLAQERKVQEQLRNQLAKVAQAVRAAGGLLQVDESIGQTPADARSGSGAGTGDGAPEGISLDAQSRQNRVAS